MLCKPTIRINLRTGQPLTQTACALDPHSLKKQGLNLYYINLNVKTGSIPDIEKNPQQAQLMLGKHQNIQDDLKAFLGLSGDETPFINLHTEENVSALASLF